MFVYKRDGRKESVKFDKISKRIARAAKGLKDVDSNVIAQKVIQGMFDGITSMELDKLSTETAYSLSVKNPNYDKLAINLAISALHKDTPSTFSECTEKLYKTVKNTKGDHQLLISSDIYKIVKKNAHILNNAIDCNRDYLFDYFGFKTLERSYLLKLPETKNEQTVYKIIERPQYLWMRVALGIHYDDIDAVLNTYEMLSTFFATHATPTLFNAGTPKNQLSSCFLLGIEDSISGIYDSIKDCALISQSAGGIGIHISNIRSKGSPIFGTNGFSNGLCPLLKVFESTARYVDQCFSGDTLIETDHGYKPINEITSKDMVKTTNGYHKVNNKKEFTHTGDFLTIKSSSGQIKVTPNHIMLVLQGVAKLPQDLIKNKLKAKLLSPAWICAKDITEYDIILKAK